MEKHRSRPEFYPELVERTGMTNILNMKMYCKKTACGGLLAVVFFAGVAFPGGAAKAASIGELTAQIQVLMAQVIELQRQLSAMTAVTPQLSVNLAYGIKGSAEVQKLQQFLIRRGYLGEGFATGNFFSLTRDAVRRFQQASGLPVTGVADEETVKVINDLLVRQAEVDRMEAGSETLTVKGATSTPLIGQDAVLVAERPEYQIDSRPAYDLAAIEQATFDMVNLERQKQGLGILRWNEQVATVARAHSSDQAGDNEVITNPDVACLYPFIRHEGFVFGFKSGERLERSGVRYRLAGENIIILPMTKNMIYRAEEAVPPCATTKETEGQQGETIEEARIRIKAMLDERIALMRGQEQLDWANREWRSVQEIASESTADWMASEGHKRNILTADFEEGAIGAAVVNDYIILTQVFLKKP